MSSANGEGRVVNMMTVDVEDYFQVSAFERHIDRSDWDRMPHRVEANTHRVLDLFGEYGVKATFFTLGWVAERYPGLIGRIVSEGHELASHGYGHQRITVLGPDAFREDVERSKAILEDLGGVEVGGYRAPSYSIVEESLWAHEILAECGFRYSSSVYPVRHDLYGIPDAPRRAYRTTADGLIECPISTVRLFGRNYPCGGGGFFRLYPYRLSKMAIAYNNRSEKRPCIFYFHPWEIDHGQPRIDGVSAKTRFRHYLNLRRMEPRLKRLLRDFSWTTMAASMAGETAALPAWPERRDPFPAGDRVR